MPDPLSSTGVATPFASIHQGTGVAQDKTSLGKEQFLNLLVTQMRYQDPSAPMDSSQIMSQTASLSTVEQLQELTSTQREAFGLQMRLSASTFVGQQVSWDEKGVTRTGVVDSASFANAKPTLKVGKDSVDLDKVNLVQAAGAKPPTTPATPETPPAAPPKTTPDATDGSGATTTGEKGSTKEPVASSANPSA